MQITKENINIKSFSMKKIKRTGGKMLKIENILKINRGPFLSTIIPKNGPITDTKVWRIPAYCRAFPLIPIKAPKVLPVQIINEIAKFIKNKIKVILQYLKVLITCFILFFELSFFNSFLLSIPSVI